jgi:hypothetical protein
MEIKVDQTNHQHYLHQITPLQHFFFLILYLLLYQIIVFLPEIKHFNQVYTFSIIQIVKLHQELLYQYVIKFIVLLDING